jgi:hypothetical protein
MRGKGRCVRAASIATILGLLAAFALTPATGAAEQVTPGGLGYAWYEWGVPPVGNGEEGFFNYDIDLTIERAPAPGTYHFWSHQFHFIEGDGGYLGLQSNGWMQGQEVGEMAIFSIWGAVGAAPSADGDCETFSGEGNGWSCRVPFDYKQNHTYRLRLWELCCAGTEQPTETLATNSAGASPAPGEEWWQASILDRQTGAETILGDIQVPPEWKWLNGSSVVWNEYYGALPRCENLPYARATFSNAKADNGAVQAPVSVTKEKGATCRNASVSLANSSATFESGYWEPSYWKAIRPKTMGIELPKLARFEGLGTIVIGGFIPQKETPIFPKSLNGGAGPRIFRGDDRGFTPKSRTINPNSNRFYAKIDLANRRGFVQMGPTCRIPGSGHNGTCHAPYDIVYAHGNFNDADMLRQGAKYRKNYFVIQLSEDGKKLKMTWSVAQSAEGWGMDLLRPRADGQIEIVWKRTDDGPTWTFYYKGDCFPSVEVMREKGGGRQIIGRLKERGANSMMDTVSNLRHVFGEYC